MVSGSDEEVEKEEEEAKKNEENSQGESAAGKLSYGMDETGRNNTEPGLATTFVKGSGGDITRKIAAQGVKFVVNPEGELRPVAPK
ncbi:MAG TPA: hypothetical protein VEJ17_00180 [Candidatus Nitrosotalea sp.]|nr:hypothetical protein [Candidatus Nitrosotalea sp.]